MSIYNEDYCRRFVERANSELGKKIYQSRWDLIQRHTDKGSILDYGCGPGVFNQVGPEEFEKYGYDINPYCGFSLPIKKDWDIVTFWDSLEHIPDYYKVLQDLKPKWLFISCPNVENVNGDIKMWRHYRPKEHIHHFDRYSLQVILESLGYRIKEISFTEGYLRNPNRPQDIIVVAAERLV